MQFKDRFVLITGGTSGIGLSMAKAFAAEGAHLALFARNEQKGKAALNALEEARVSPEQKFFFSSVDTSVSTSVEQGFGQLSAVWGAPDTLINCAGITKDRLLLRMSEDDWDSVLSINLKSVFLVTKHAVRHMLKQRFGRIINISSVIGLTGNPGQVNYSASKAGMIGFTRSLAKEVATKGITVNCIAPGFFDTEMTMVLSENSKEELLKKIPMGRMGDTKEISHAALFFANALSSYVTGQTLAVDGGLVS